ncbi:unnamed protein product [Haemonchus placei]|uniref:Uncharacterized protein n=1 Tax=Haemonchus placei TaxID=6290 RepID=A0A0N4W901_HAEPC|nr:unnamed protein product [Haemonchus placei]
MSGSPARDTPRLENVDTHDSQSVTSSQGPSVITVSANTSLQFPPSGTCGKSIRTRNAQLRPGIVHPQGIHPVLYRVKSLFGTGARLETVHMEVPLPDRMDLHTVMLDQFSVNILTGKHRIDVFHILIGDLVLVYTLLPSTKYMRERLPYLETVEEASHHRKPTIWRVDEFAFIHRDLTETLGYIVSVTSIYSSQHTGHHQDC